MRETLNVRAVLRSRSWPTTYQLPSSRRSAYGLTVRSPGRARRGLQYPNLTVRCFEIADSSFDEPARRAPASSRGADADALGGLGRRLRKPVPAEREVLEREAERLGVGELPLQVVQGRLERGELVVVELEALEEVVLGAQRVELLAGELVPLRLERDAERR